MNSSPAFAPSSNDEAEEYFVSPAPSSEVDENVEIAPAPSSNWNWKSDDISAYIAKDIDWVCLLDWITYRSFMSDEAEDLDTHWNQYNALEHVLRSLLNCSLLICVMFVD